MSLWRIALLDVNAPGDTSHRFLSFLYLEISMAAPDTILKLSQEEVRIVDAALSVYRASIERRIRAESNPAIRDIVAKDAALVDALRSRNLVLMD